MHPNIHRVIRLHLPLPFVCVEITLPTHVTQCMNQYTSRNKAYRYSLVLVSTLHRKFVIVIRIGLFPEE